MTESTAFFLLAVVFAGLLIALWSQGRRVHSLERQLLELRWRTDEFGRQMKVARYQIDEAASGYRTRMGRINHRIKRLEKSA